MQVDLRPEVALTVRFFFFFQAEDGIRDYKVTGVQTCALPICNKRSLALDLKAPAGKEVFRTLARGADVLVENLRPGTMSDLELDWPRLSRKIGRASCRERV